MFSPLPLLADFGLVVTVIVITALLSSLVVMPPLLVWLDERRESVAASAMRQRFPGFRRPLSPSH